MPMQDILKEYIKKAVANVVNSNLKQIAPAVASLARSYVRKELMIKGFPGPVQPWTLPASSPGPGPAPAPQGPAAEPAGLRAMAPAPAPLVRFNAKPATEEDRFKDKDGKWIMVEAEDENDKWWPVVITGRHQDGIHYSVEVQDGYHTKWPVIHRHYIRPLVRNTTGVVGFSNFGSTAEVSPHTHPKAATDEVVGKHRAVVHQLACDLSNFCGSKEALLESKNGGLDCYAEGAIIMDPRTATAEECAAAGGKTAGAYTCATVQALWAQDTSERQLMLDAMGGDPCLVTSFWSTQCCLAAPANSGE